MNLTDSKISTIVLIGESNSGKTVLSKLLRSVYQHYDTKAMNSTNDLSIPCVHVGKDTVAVANFVLSLNMPNSLGSKFFLNLSAINRFSNYVKKIAKRQEAGLYAEVNDTKNYDKIVSDIVPVVKEIAFETFSDTAKEVRENHGASADDILDVGASDDGSTWYSSMNGFVTTISVENKKIFDLEPMIRHCKSCTKKKTTENIRFCCM